MKILCSRSNLLAGALAFAGMLTFKIPAVAQHGGERPCRCRRWFLDERASIGTDAAAGIGANIGGRPVGANMSANAGAMDHSSLAPSDPAMVEHQL